MEPRRITIVTTREQKKYVINSAATTLGELKADLDENGINYQDMTFMEGLTKTELKENSSILPHDVPRINRTTGESYITNELVFMLTNSEKKIRSGVDRTEIYAFIKANNLQEEIKNRFGKNFTMCKTVDLATVMEEVLAAMQAAAQPVVKEEPKCNCKIVQAFKYLVDALCDYDAIGYDIRDDIYDMLGESKELVLETKNTQSPYSDEEIKEMFGI